METSKQMWKTFSVGDAAVEGLMYGMVAGLAMAAFVILVEAVAGIAPLVALGYFDAGSAASNVSPVVGLFTHVAVSGIYGVVFGMVAMVVARMFGARMTLGTWLALGVLYGALLFGIAEWIILPRTNSPLAGMPMWAFALAHLVYGIVLAGLSARKK